MQKRANGHYRIFCGIARIKPQATASQNGSEKKTLFSNTKDYRSMKCHNDSKSNTFKIGKKQIICIWCFSPDITLILFLSGHCFVSVVRQNMLLYYLTFFIYSIIEFSPMTYGVVISYCGKGYSKSRKKIWRPGFFQKTNEAHYPEY